MNNERICWFRGVLSTSFVFHCVAALLVMCSYTSTAQFFGSSEALLAQQSGGQSSGAARSRSMPDGSLSYLGAAPGTGFPTGVPGSQPERAARRFLESNGAVFGLSSALSSLDRKNMRTDGGRTFIRFTQTYSGVPVFGSGVSIQVNQSGLVESVLADTMGNPKAIELGYLSLTPTLLREDAELFGLADMEVRLDVSDLFA
ncbi:MAG: hypothetical protein VCB26_05335, partial [Candidatus Hydrogenedentota bacterium]